MLVCFNIPVLSSLLSYLVRDVRDIRLLAPPYTVPQCDNHHSLMRLRFVCLMLLLAASGCGYHQAGTATHLPVSVHTLAVPFFSTHSQAFLTEAAYTQAVIRELNMRTRYRILSHTDADADATLTGTILSQSVAPLTYDSTSGQTSSYLITITARVLLTARDGSILYRNDSLAYREQYQSTQDLSGFVQEDSAAVRRVARDFSQALVSDLLESF